MPTLSAYNHNLIQIFTLYFSNCIWQHAQVLLIGAILVPGLRTVAALLRIMGLSALRQVQVCHRLLNRAAWSSWALSHISLKFLLQTFVPFGRNICGLDDAIERWRGAKSKAKGMYRDPVHANFTAVF